jgi:hypothetical protein
VDVVAVSGNDIYIGGKFRQIGNVRASRIARWDGHRWHELGSDFANGVDIIVQAIVPDGDNVYVGGQFYQAGDVEASNLAVYHPSTNKWEAFSGGVQGSKGFAIVSSMIKNGNDLYVAGYFDKVGSANKLVNNIAKWDGSAWSGLGSGVNNQVNVMAMNGGNLYVGGEFTTAGDAPASHIAVWSTTSNTWSALGAGIDSSVFAVAFNANDVYVGGVFTKAGGAPARNIARWNDVTRTWSQLDTMIANGAPSGVRALATDGVYLYAGGDFRMGRKTVYDRIDSVRSIGRWNLNSGGWSSMTENLIEYDNQGPAVQAMYLKGRQLIVGGHFPLGSYYEMSNITSYDLDARTWTALSQGVNGSSAGYLVDGRRTARDTLGVRAMLSKGTDVYVGGVFNSVGGIHANSIAKWDGTNWSALGTGVTDSVLNFASMPIVTSIAAIGNDIYVGGRFNRAGTSPARGFAKWDGTKWAALMDTVGNFDTVFTIASVGGSVYAGGVIRTGVGLPSGSVRRWNGTGWDTLGLEFDRQVRAIAVYNNMLYIGGDFTKVGQTSARGLVVYDPASKTVTPVPNGPNGNVRTIVVDGNTLYIGGDFEQIGGIAASRIVKWTPSSNAWTALGSGFSKTVFAIGVYTGGIYAGGDFSTSTGDAGNFVARWDGTQWLPVGDGTDSRVYALAPVGYELYMGGNFINAGGQDAHYMAHWIRVVLGVDRQDDESSIAGLATIGSYPNPISTDATIALSLARRATVSLSICSDRGETIAKLYDGTLEPGDHRFTWSGQGLADGVYFCILRSGDRVTTQKLVLMH